MGKQSYSPNDVRRLEARDKSCFRRVLLLEPGGQGVGSPLGGKRNRDEKNGSGKDGRKAFGRKSFSLEIDEGNRKGRGKVVIPMGAGRRKTDQNIRQEQ